MSDAALPDPAAPRSPVRWLVFGVLMAALIVMAASIYARVEVRRLRDEQVALTERHRLDTLQLIRIDNNVVDHRGHAARHDRSPASRIRSRRGSRPSRVSASTWIRRSRGNGRSRRSHARRRRRVNSTRRHGGSGRRSTAASPPRRAGRDEEARTIFTTDATSRQAELTHQVSQLLIANTRADDEGTARARAVYDAVDRQILWLNVGLVTALLVAGGTVVLAVRRSIIALQQVSAERRALSWRMIRLQEDVQAGLARELHDEFGQVLTALGFGLVADARHVEQGTTPARDGGRQNSPNCRTSPSRCSTASGSDRERSHPVVLDDFGLEHALRSHVELVGRQSGLPIEVTTTGELAGLPTETATHLYRILQESLTNVVRHAGASEVAVSADARPGRRRAHRGRRWAWCAGGAGGVARAGVDEHARAGGVDGRNVRDGRESARRHARHGVGAGATGVTGNFKFQNFRISLPSRWFEALTLP